MSADLPTKIICPLGMGRCREIKDGAVHQCAWLVSVQGKSPQSDEVVDEWRCSMAWAPILMVEVAQTNRGQTAALESLRNEMVQGQQQFSTLVLAAAAASKKGLQLID